MSICPKNAAICSAAAPSFSLLRFGFAPLSSRSLAASECPVIAAAISGVNPTDGALALMFWPSASCCWMASRSPVAAAAQMSTFSSAVADGSRVKTGTASNAMANTNALFRLIHDVLLQTVTHRRPPTSADSDLVSLLQRYSVTCSHNACLFHIRTTVQCGFQHAIALIIRVIHGSRINIFPKSCTRSWQILATSCPEEVREETDRPKTLGSSMAGCRRCVSFWRKQATARR